MTGVVEQSRSTAFQFLAKLADETLHVTLINIDSTRHLETQCLERLGHIARIVWRILQFWGIGVRAIAYH
jgi:hypothetical protein